MDVHLRLPWLLLAWVAVFGPVLVFAQTTSPSNNSVPVEPDALGQLLTVTRPGKKVAYRIDPLTMPAGAGQQPLFLQQLAISGNIQLTTPLSVMSLQLGQIAYINCEPDAYPGNISAAQTIKLAADRIIAQSTQTSETQHGAIILYSTQSDWCMFGASGNFTYMMVYTTTNSSNAADLESWLKDAGQPTPQATITIDDTNGQNATLADALGPSPSTAVAMIILYSITGIITALFLVIIVTGAIRAHRHPERYGPRVIAGRPRQSRAKGIARAMLETLPIVKFGERDEPLGKFSGDAELAESSTAHPLSSEAPRPPTALDTSVRGTPVLAEGETVEISKAAGVGGSPEQAAEPAEHNAEVGLACSVCTDDFIKGQDIRVLPCDHKFHPECIDPWLLNVSGTCPLCRVNLRPTNSLTDDPTHENMSDLTDLDPSTDGLQPTGPTSAQDPSHPANAAMTNRRRSAAFGLLNIRRMRDATPEERVAALRGLRNANRENRGEAQVEAEGAGRARTRLHGRLTRLWGHGEGGAGGAEAGGVANEANEADGASGGATAGGV